MLIKSAEFVKSAVQPDQCPPGDLPEVAFSGRSNVGKSSLINCLVQRKKLVRTSRTPGQTQALNFFRINNVFYFVDLPGYGFAKVPESVRARWGPLVEGYLASRKSLRGVVQILDSRHPPTADDVNLWHWFSSYNIPAIAVLTKADKLKRSQWNAQLNLAASRLGDAPEHMILFSAVTNQGRDVLLDRLEAWLDHSEL